MQIELTVPLLSPGQQSPVLKTCPYTALQTYEGIDRCGERLAGEVTEYVAIHPDLERISLIGHSMGGLIGRYALGMSSL